MAPLSPLEAGRRERLEKGKKGGGRAYVTMFNIFLLYFSSHV